MIERDATRPKGVSFVSIIIFAFHLDALSLNGSVMISRNKLISHLLYNCILNPSMVALSNPFRRGSQGWGVFINQNHGAGGGNGSIMVVVFCELCVSGVSLAKTLPSGSFLFPPERT